MSSNEEKLRRIRERRQMLLSQKRQIQNIQPSAKRSSGEQFTLTKRPEESGVLQSQLTNRQVDELLSALQNSTSQSLRKTSSQVQETAAYKQSGEMRQLDILQFQPHFSAAKTQKSVYFDSSVEGRESSAGETASRPKPYLWQVMGPGVSDQPRGPQPVQPAHSHARAQSAQVQHSRLLQQQIYASSSPLAPDTDTIAASDVLAERQISEKLRKRCTAAVMENEALRLQVENLNNVLDIRDQKIGILEQQKEVQAAIVRQQTEELAQYRNIERPLYILLALYNQGYKTGVLDGQAQKQVDAVIKIRQAEKASNGMVVCKFMDTLCGLVANNPDKFLKLGVDGVYELYRRLCSAAQ